MLNPELDNSTECNSALSVWKIPKGESHDKKVITEIAPTIAQKLKITLPNGTESQVLIEILEK